ncbi:MAG: Anti-sigma-B factor antagonist [Phycisphaerae bacterium]|nr:Anti-sigma-B factor antagonist [Phycisphaerae bacterium]
MSDKNRYALRPIADPTLCLFEVKGEIDIRTSPELHDALMRAVADRPARLVLDLAGVTYMDSSGVGTLVEIKRQLERNDGTLVLAALREQVKGLFEITRLDKFFKIAASVEDARAL